MADITLTVDVSSLNQASKTLNAFGATVSKNSSIIGLSRGVNTLQNNIRELVTAQQKGTISGSTYQLGLLQVKRAYEKLGLTTQAATAAVRRYAAELKKQDATRIALKAANDLAAANDKIAKASDKIAKAEARATAKLQQESDRREKLRVKEADRAEKEAQKLVDANNKIIASEIKRRAEEDKNAAAYAQNFQAQVGPNLGLGAQGISAGASASAFEDGIEELRLKYDQIYASSQLYERSLAEIDKAHLLGILSESKHKASVESLNQEYQNFQNGIRQVGNRFVQHSNQTSDGMNRMGVAAQQTGYQVSDFIVQVQGGTNPLVAFSQQMTQMAGLLYLLPPAIQATTIPLLGFKIALSTAFAGVAILIPLLASLAMAFFNSGEEAKAAADGPIKDAEDRIRSLDSALKDYLLTKQAASLGMTKDELISSTGLDAAIKALDEADERLKQAQENVSISGNLESLTGRTTVAGPLTGLLSSVYGLVSAYKVLSDEEKALIAAQEERTEAAERVRIVQEKGAGTYNKQLDALYKTHALELARLNLGEDSLAFKEKQAEVDRKNYEDSLRSSGELNAVQIGYLVGLYKAHQDALKARQAELTEAERVKQATADQLTYMGKTKQESDRFVASLKSAYALLASSHAAASGIADQMTRAANAYFVSNSVGGASYMANQYSLYGEGRVSGEKLAKESGALYGGVSVLPSSQGANQGGTGPAEATQTAIEKLQEQLAVERELIGTSEAYQKVRQALGEEFKTTSPEVIAGLVEQATQVERLIDLEKQREQVLGTVKSSMEDTLMSIVDGTKSARDAFKAMAADIIKELYRVYVVQQLVNSVSGFFAPSGGSSVSPPGRAAGGSMMANMAYMVGENGPELVIPRHSGTVVNAKQTASAVGGGGNFTQNLSINVTGSDAAMVRTEVAKMIPQITNATKAAVLDAKQRGGQFAAAFR